MVSFPEQNVYSMHDTDSENPFCQSMSATVNPFFIIFVKQKMTYKEIVFRGTKEQQNLM